MNGKLLDGTCTVELGVEINTKIATCCCMKKCGETPPLQETCSEYEHKLS